MAPLNRGRVGPGGAPTGLNALYYGQRAGAGLIVAEGAEISPDAPQDTRLCLAADAQVPGWRQVTEAVHGSSGRIVLQLCHFAAMPFRASAVAQAFAAAAHRARTAGFDGVEIHAGEPHLVGTVLQTRGRQRSRLLTDVLDAVTPVFGPERVGVRLTLSAFKEERYLLERIAGRIQARNIGYLHLVLARGENFPPSLRAHYRGPVILAGQFDRAGAQAALADGSADLIAFGMPFVANPDLVDVLRQDLPLAQADPATLRGGGAGGYTDYPRR